jgi:hypothetical protein
MTDGPFKNMKLGSCWKRFAEAVQNAAVSHAECVAFASDAVVREVLIGDIPALLRDLKKQSVCDQFELDPLYLVEGIFDSYSKTPFADTFQKELLFRLANQLPTELALGQALEATAIEQIAQAQSRFVEECIRACNTGEMNQEQFADTVEKIEASFNAIDRHSVCKALRTGNKNAFKEATSEKEDIDEGPVCVE